MGTTDWRYVGSYRIERTIADGLYGKIKLAFHQLTQEKVCLLLRAGPIDQTHTQIKVVIKIVEKKRIDIPRFREAELMKRLANHKHIVRLLEVLEVHNVIMHTHSWRRHNHAHTHIPHHKSCPIDHVHTCRHQSACIWYSTISKAGNSTTTLWIRADSMVSNFCSISHEKF